MMMNVGEEAKYATQEYYQQKAYAQAAHIAGAPTVDVAQEPMGLVRYANQISEAAAQIDFITAELNRIAMGIHGPRPEAVGNAGVKSQPNVDSLASRVSMLMDSLNQLQQAYRAIVR